MGVKLLTRGVDASAVAGECVYPIDSGPAYHSAFGLGLMRRNLATGGLCAIVGSPQANLGYGVFSGNDYVDSNVFEPDAFTLMALINAPTANGSANALAISTNTANAKSGSSLFLNNNGPTGVVTTLNGSSEVLVTAGAAAPQGQWVLGAARFNGTALSVNNLTAQTGSQAGISYPRSKTGATYHVGAGYGGTGAPIGLAGAAIFPRALSDTELNSMAAFMRATAALSGITV